MKINKFHHSSGMRPGFRVFVILSPLEVVVRRTTDSADLRSNVLGFVILINFPSLSRMKASNSESRSKDSPRTGRAARTNRASALMRVDSMFPSS